MSNLNHLYMDRKGVVFVDLSQLALSTAMATFEPATKFTPEIIRTLILSTLKHNVLKFKNEGYEKFVICVDNAKHGYWRRQFAPYYKMNRAISREKKKDDFDFDGYFNGLGVVVEELKENFPYIVIDVRHGEADDAFGVLTKYYLDEGWRVLLCSSDGDFTQLHTCEHVVQYSPIQKKMVTVRGSCPEEDCLEKIIKGDKKDNVASIKVRGNFYLTKNDGQRTPMTSGDFIKTCIGKTDEELEVIMRNDIELTYTKSDKTKKSGNTKGLAYLLKSLVDDYGIEAEKAAGLMEKHPPETIMDLLAKMRMRRFAENRVLIDFNYIRDDIKEAILKTHHEYVPAPRGKLYPYFVRCGLVKLINQINNF